ncbi:MAG TPA: ABC transporter permease [Actinomycetota bacterium]|nr:ABC transporter permease [Actinomycetota bacterium]
MTAVAIAFSDSIVIAKRNLIKIKRVPDMLVWTLMSPIMFVLLFGYVFGGAIDVRGTTYREFLIAGVFAQTVIFGASWTGVGMAEDMTKGVIDRFRSLPMSRTAVLAGRTASDIVSNSLSILLMGLTGLLIGWRIRTGPLEAIGGILLLLLFAYAFSWIMAWVGLKVKTVEMVNNAGFMVIFPLTFVANTFVPVETLAGPLKAFAYWNPVSAVAQAAREAFGNTAGQIPPDVWSLQNPALYTLIWVGIILAVFIPLSTREYNKASSR